MTHDHGLSIMLFRQIEPAQFLILIIQQSGKAVANALKTTGSRIDIDHHTEYGRT